ncbi:MAG: hypothetical protein FJ403_15220 [Verrucomicrobia bacterium]|nr:hypothetical protein [Verrucomicrobiota bacterium]
MKACLLLLLAASTPVFGASPQVSNRTPKPEKIGYKPLYECAQFYRFFPIVSARSQLRRTLGGLLVRVYSLFIW